jgi:hypothetical protein
MQDEWISTREAALTLRVSERTLQNSLKDPEWRAREWGQEGEGWRYRPVVRRKTYELRRSLVERKAGTT